MQPKLRSVFVGREEELRRLREASNDVLASVGRVLLLSGDLGIGKTMLAKKFATDIAAEKFTVLTGTSFEGGFTPPLWMWIQILRSSVETEDGKRALQELSSNHRSVVESLVPGVSEITPTTEEAAANSRFELFDASTSFLARLSRKIPLMLVLDDMHWADESDLAMFEFAARQLANERVLIVGTYREVEAMQHASLGRSLGVAASLPGFESVTLPELTDNEMLELIERTKTGGPNKNQDQMLVERAAGNPFFGRELTRGIPGSTDLPNGVRDAVNLRLENLDSSQKEFLRVAAVVGQEFSVEEVSESAAAELDQVKSAFVDVRSRALIEEKHSSPGVFGFSHPLIREVLLQGLTPSERADIHIRVRNALIRIYGEHDPRHVVAIAAHSRAGQSLLDIDQVRSSVMIAGLHAKNTFAFLDAANYFQWVAESMELEPDSPEKASILENLATTTLESAQLSNQEGWNHLTASVRMYIRLGLYDDAVKAASFPAVVGEIDGVVALVEEALAVVSQGSVEHGWLLARYVVALADSARFEDAEVAFHQAMEIATEQNERDLRARLLGHGAQTAYRANDPEKCAERGLSAIDLGLEVEDALSIIKTIDFCIESLCSLERTDDARRLIARVQPLMERAAHPGGRSAIKQTKYWIAFANGDRDELNTIVREAVGAPWQSEHRKWVEASRNLEAGVRDEALLESLDPMFSKSRMDAAHIALGIASTWLQMSSDSIILGKVKQILQDAESQPRPSAEGDVRRAALRVLIGLAEGNSPEDSDLALISDSPGFNIPRSNVPRDRILGMVALSESNYSGARHYIDSSIAACRKAAFRPALAWSLFDLTKLASANDDSVHIDEAEIAAQECEALATELQMPALVRLVRHTISSLRTPDSETRPGGLSEREIEVLLLIAEGKSNPEIAEALFISRHTVVRHVTNIYSKIECSSRSEATAFAIANGLTAKKGSV